MSEKNINNLNQITNPESNTRSFFKLKELDGDQGIWLGQSILALISLNRSPAYTDKMNKSFTIELFTSLMIELDITPEDIQKEIENRANWNDD